MKSKASHSALVLFGILRVFVFCLFFVCFVCFYWEGYVCFWVGGRLLFLLDFFFFGFWFFSSLISNFYSFIYLFAYFSIKEINLRIRSKVTSVLSVTFKISVFIREYKFHFKLAHTTDIFIINICDHKHFFVFFCFLFPIIFTGFVVVVVVVLGVVFVCFFLFVFFVTSSCVFFCYLCVCVCVCVCFLDMPVFSKNLISDIIIWFVFVSERRNPKRYNNHFRGRGAGALGSST